MTNSLMELDFAIQHILSFCKGDRMFIILNKQWKRIYEKLCPDKITIYYLHQVYNPDYTRIAVSLGCKLGFLGYHQVMMKEKNLDALKLYISQKPKNKSEKWKIVLYACKTGNFELLEWIKEEYIIKESSIRTFTIEPYYYMRCLQVLKDKDYYDRFRPLLDEIE